MELLVTRAPADAGRCPFALQMRKRIIAQLLTYLFLRFDRLKVQAGKFPNPFGDHIHHPEEA